MTQVATDEAAVKDVLASAVAAWDANDADAFAELYTDDASVITAGSHQQGKETIRAFMAGGFAGPLKGTKSMEDPQDVRFVTDDVAVVTSLGGFIFAGEDKLRDDMERRATWVIVRRGNDWRVETYHNCAS